MNNQTLCSPSAARPPQPALTWLPAGWGETCAAGYKPTGDEWAAPVAQRFQPPCGLPKGYAPRLSGLHALRQRGVAKKQRSRRDGTALIKRPANPAGVAILETGK